MLVKFCSEKKDTWNTHLDTLTFAYSTSRHESTKYSPFELMFGRKPVLPVELEVTRESPEEILDSFINAPEAGDTMMTKLIETRYITISLHNYNYTNLSFTFSRSNIIEKAKLNIEVAQEKQREHYNRKHASISLHTMLFVRCW